MDQSSQLHDGSAANQPRVVQPEKHRRMFPRLTQVEACFLLFCFFVYAFWMLTFPWQSYGPDEYMRYDIPEFIYLNKALPTGPEESIRNPVWGVSYGFDISLPYIIGAFFMWITSKFSIGRFSLMMATRLVSVFSTVGAVYFAILFCRKQWGINPMRWIFIVLTAMLPQIVFLASYFNLDSFSLLTIMMILYSWKICLEYEWNTRALVLLSVSLGLCFLSYYFAYSYILVTVFVYCAWFIAHRKEQSYKVFIRKGLFIMAIAFAICGWKFIRNTILYGGDVFALNASSKYAELYAMDAYKPSLRDTFEKTGMSLMGMLFGTTWFKGSYRSLIGVFGYLSVWLPEPYYGLYTCMFYAGAAGTLVKGIRSFAANRRLDNRARNETILIGMAALVAGCVTILISAYYSWHSDFQAQGRYILAIVPFLFMVTTVGLQEWLELFCKLVPGKPGLIERMRLRCSWVVVVFVLTSMMSGFIACLKAFLYVML